MSFLHICLSLFCCDLSQRFFIFLSEINADFFDICKDDEHFSVNSLCKLSGCKIFFDDGTCTSEMVVLLQHRDSTASGSNYNLISIKKCLDGIQLDDFYRIWCGYDTTETLARLFNHIISFFTLFICLLCIHIASENFGRCIESFIIWIDNYLGENSTDSSVDSTIKKFLTDSILKVITDISLAHG